MARIFASTIHFAEFRTAYESKKADSSSLISIEGRETESLDGRWSFSPDPYESCLRKRWYEEKKYAPDGRELPVDYDFEHWDEIDVPSCWNLQRPELFYFESMGVYFRTFDYRKHSDDERAFIAFEGASYRAYVFLNGVYLGCHDGASTPFMFEITDELKEHNRLVVAVEAERKDTRVPMSNNDWFNYGGIYRDVYIFRTGKRFIKNWFMRLLPNTDFSKIALDVTLSDDSDSEIHVSIPELGIEKDVKTEKGKASTVIEAHPELWSPDNPKLYDVSLSIEGDTISDRVGFREIRTEGRDIILNGKPVFLKGVSVHEDSTRLGKTTDETTIREMIRVAKDELHAQMLRLAHYPHSRLFARIADEEGIILWEEVPVYWSIAFSDKETYKDAENQLSELILRDRNRASVCIWSVGNENPDTDERFAFMSSLAQKARELDETRCISAACLVNESEERIDDRLTDALDIIGVNEYYGWYSPDFDMLRRVLENSHPDKPVIISEVGADARSGNHGPKDMLWTEEFQEEFYKKQVKTIEKCSYIKGMTPWILYDFRASRRFNRYQEGYNRKGLIDDDRKTKKKAFRILADFYEGR